MKIGFIVEMLNDEAAMSRVDKRVRMYMVKRRCETKDLCFSQKEVSISPERSKHFRKMLTSFREKQGASTRKAQVSDPQSPAVGVQKSVFVFLCSLSAR